MQYFATPHLTHCNALCMMQLKPLASPNMLRQDTWHSTRACPQMIVPMPHCVAIPKLVQPQKDIRGGRQLPPELSLNWFTNLLDAIAAIAPKMSKLQHILDVAKGPKPRSVRHSLLLHISEIGFRHGDDVLQVKIGVRHVDLDLESRSHQACQKMC